MGTRTRTQPARRKIQQGRWWRYDRYVIVDGYIRPAPGAVLHEVYPWKEYDRARRLKGVKAPHEELIAIGHRALRELLAGKGRPRVERLSQETRSAVLEWCGKYGLLGLLQQRTLFAVMRPRRAKPGEDEWGVGGLVQVKYLRTRKGWRTKLHSGVPKDSPSFVMTTEARFEDGIEMSKVEEAWGPFFPHVPANKKSSYEYPMPGSPEFWAGYAEGVMAFVLEATRLTHSANAFAWLKDPKENPAMMKRLGAFKTRAAEREAGLNLVHGETEELNALLATNSDVVLLMKDGTLRGTWVSTTLLGSLAAMMKQEVLNERHPLTCATCGQTFFAERPSQVHCDAQCREKWKYMRKKEVRHARSRVRDASRTRATS